MSRPLLPAVALLTLLLPSAAYGMTGEVPPALSMGAGVVGLLAAATLLAGMLSLRRIASGAFIAQNISYAMLAVLCLAASVLVTWAARFMPTAFSTDQARLGADLLSIAAMVFFGIYFLRVRHAMSRFIKRLTGEEQLLAAVIDPDAVVEE